MRQIGTIANYEDALRFGAYLRRQNIASRLEKQSEGWTIWVFDGIRAAWAEIELEAFVRNPHDIRFQPSLNDLLNRLPPLEQQIVEMHRRGYAIAMIAQSLSVYERKIRRVLDRFRRLTEQQDCLPRVSQCETKGLQPADGKSSSNPV